MTLQNTQKNELPARLPNKEEFADLAAHLLEFSERTNSKSALLYIHFNDSLKDPELKILAIKAIEHMLLLLARDADTFAYVGDLNFVNLSIETSEQHIPKLIEKLKSELSQPIDLADGSSISLSVKIGSAQFPTQAKDCQGLLDIAKNFS